MQVRQGTLSSTSVEISWEKPLSPNGIVSLYYVYSDRIKVQIVRDVTVTSIQLKNLIPFTKYAVWVVAANVEGNAVLKSSTDRASMTQFTTLVDGKRIFLHVI